MSTTDLLSAQSTERQTNEQASRRAFLTRAGASAGALAVGAMLAGQASAQSSTQSNAAGAQSNGSAAAGVSPNQGAFWPNGARLVVSISMQFEAGGQPAKGADNPFPKVDFPASVPADLAAQTWFAYGYREGIPRMLDLWDRHGVKVTTHMIGEAAKAHPDIARQIVARGHEVSGHGPRWSSQYAMTRAQEKEFLIQAMTMIEDVTGQRPIGFNANWLRRGPNTLPLLQELGYVYHIDDLRHDEPFIETVNGKDFAVVPYTLRNNDILLVEGRNYSPGKFLDQIKLEFDQLYEEGGSRRRMMSISAHDRISGTPQMTRAWDEFLLYAKSHPDVAFMRKDDIAHYALQSPLTLRETETI
ncbi:allantoinase [Pararobbsia alpina]|uniref:polysaccharide deacetylase family protein n=1 Tax=Pararobbsia alpina TaxID=621374 RepID=UPI0039A6FC55